jgi:hypothetical protein
VMDTGLRVSKALNLRHDGVDFDNLILKVLEKGPKTAGESSAGSPARLSRAMLPCAWGSSPGSEVSLIFVAWPYWSKGSEPLQYQTQL